MPARGLSAMAVEVVQPPLPAVLEVVMPGAVLHQREEVHPSHRMGSAGMLVFCARCGRYSHRKASRALLIVCPGTAVGFAAVQLRRIQDRRHPRTGVPVG